MPLLSFTGLDRYLADVQFEPITRLGVDPQIYPGTILEFCFFDRVDAPVTHRVGALAHTRLRIPFSTEGWRRAQIHFTDGTNRRLEDMRPMPFGYVLRGGDYRHLFLQEPAELQLLADAVQEERA